MCFCGVVKSPKYEAILFQQLAGTIPKPKSILSGKGRPPFFDVCGGIALQVLKAYYRYSDAQLIELLNGNWQMQLFCGLLLHLNQPIRDKNIVGRWRYLSCYLEAIHRALHLGLCDATVFESYMAYPTDTSFLWKSCCQVQSIKEKKEKHIKKVITTTPLL